MCKMILKKAFILCLPLLAYPTYATSELTKEALAKKCQDLSQTVASLVQ